MIYLEVTDYNERFADRVMRGFGDPAVKEQLAKMFEQRYPVPASLDPA